ncbi:MAG: sulfatase-like hydrolase/transferase [Rubripirellula sp.]
MVRCLLAALLLVPLQVSLAAADAPNILIVLSDDMGYGDLGCTGTKKLKTPNVDAMAGGGVLCTQAYVASPVCSPSRAGLMTGRDPRRFGYEGNLNQSAANYATRPELLGLPPGEHTIADHLKAAGYATSLIGKWHLGTGEGFHPHDRGFDYFCGMLGGSHSYFLDAEKNRLERNGQALTKFSSSYITDFFTDEAIDWIKTQETEPSKPWFMYLSYNAPHGPMHATEEDLKRFEHIADVKRRTYAAMMWALDRGIGRVMDHLKETGEWDNTLVCFFSDNGGPKGNASWNGPFSGSKGCLLEGGVRVPMIWSWPQGLPGNQTHDGAVSALDLLPTFLAAAKAEALPLAAPRSHEDKNNRRKSVAKFGEYDGINLLPQLNGKAGPTRRTLYWRLQGQKAILDGDDKLISLSHRMPQLFRPATDLGETEDRISSDPTRANELFQMLGKWESLHATVPLWGSSPYWRDESAKQYDSLPARDEP